MGTHTKKDSVMQRNGKSSWLILACILLFGVTCVYFGWKYYSELNKQNSSIKEINSNIADMQDKMDKILKDDLLAPLQTVDPNIEFLKEQIKSHQEFIERERDFLVWMLGVIFAVGGISIGFVGMKSKKDIEQLVNNTYKGNIDDQITSLLADAVGGNKNLQYLKASVKQESRAQSKKICFIRQEGSTTFDQIIYATRSMYSDIDVRDNIKVEEDTNYFFSELIKNQKYLDTHIFVYEVPSDEYGQDKTKNTDGSTLKYEVLNDFCKSKDRLAILFCRNRINSDILYLDTSTTVQYFSKLYETLHTLRYI